MTRDAVSISFAFGTFLQTLTEPSRGRLLALGSIARFQSGHALIRQGDTDDLVFVLLKSVAKVTARAENGAEALLAVRVSGDIVGDMAPLTGVPRSTSVTTCSESVVCVIKGPVFVDFMNQHAAVGVALSRLIGERLRWANERRLDFAGYDADICLARLLLAFAERHGRQTDAGTDIGVPLTQAELGGLIGAKEGTIQKAMRGLRNRGLVRNSQRRITITDPRGLAAYADLAPTVLHPD
ncbi:Crp/Fnr family transcriptional regulator [Microtetraspora sp. NBRC 13810]|uniref:Crp/Fnr family transcriptional regulator n=1 Tax=Microtetraspora sp. NBRC 13810 TaxID=3030990 RepID=UPI0024A4866F|nr:Crp/Fnr family transcriptional regulator [Microtetraspora sp. NBRC 13810]GLW07856.1 Crp/Fnr family transcriptional regulator [Microtetraspora sp. NBRC 13810]